MTLLYRTADKLYVHLSFIIASQRHSRRRFITIVRAEFECFHQLKEFPGIFDVPEIDAETLNVQEEIFDVDHFVSYQRLNEDADQSNEAILKKAIFRLFAGFDASGDEQLEEFLR